MFFKLPTLYHFDCVGGNIMYAYNGDRILHKNENRQVRAELS